MSHSNSFPKPKVKHSTIVHDAFFKIRRDQLCLPNSEEYAYDTLITPGQAVVILGITEQGLFVLNQEYRHPTKQILLSCPGGYLNKQEDPLEGGKREFEEETGFSAKSYSLMGSAFPYPGISEQKIYYVKALGAKKTTEPLLEPAEFLQPTLVSYEKILKAISTGTNIDASLCTALFFYQFVTT